MLACDGRAATPPPAAPESTVACTVTVSPGEDVASQLSPDASICLAAGVHRVNLDLTHGVTLRGEPGTVLDGGGRGPVVRIGANGQQIRLEGLEIRGGSHEFGSGLLVEGYSDVSLAGAPSPETSRSGGGAGLGVRRGRVLVTGGRIPDEVIVTTVAEARFDGTHLGTLVASDGADVAVRSGKVDRLVVRGTSTRQPRVAVQGSEVGATDNTGQYPGMVVVESRPRPSPIDGPTSGAGAPGLVHATHRLQ